MNLKGKNYYHCIIIIATLLLACQFSVFRTSIRRIFRKEKIGAANTRVKRSGPKTVRPKPEAKLELDNHKVNKDEMGKNRGHLIKKVGSDTV